MEKIIISTVRTKNFTARIIHFGMFLWAILRRLKIKRINNHAEFRWGFDKTLEGGWTFGAIAEGGTKRLWYDYVISYHKKYFSHTDFLIEVSPETYRAMMEKIVEMIGKPYEKENFWFHLLKILFGKWRGSNSIEEVYCYEVVGELLRCDKRYRGIDVHMNPYEWDLFLKAYFPYKTTKL